MVILRIMGVLCGVLAGGICHAQTPGSATVSGIVTDAVTRLPLEGATVTVARDGVMASFALTDASGEYTLEVAPGSVRMWASRGNYLEFKGNVPLDLNAGDSIRQNFELHPSPRIAGSITDADTGERVHGCIVFAMRRILSMDEAWFTSAGIPTADSRNGTFETVGLSPGDYILEITGCAWSYYPGVSRIEMATPISVTETGVSALSIRLKVHDLRRISGVADHGAVDVRLVRHLQDVAQDIAQVRADASGHFKFDSVPEGEFHLVTSAGADEVVTVTDHDVEDVKLKGRPTLKIEVSQMRVNDGDAMATRRGELVPVFDREPGEYWARVPGLSPDLGVAAVLANGLTLPNGSITIGGVSPQLTFLVTSHFGSLTGVAVPQSLVFAIREPFAEYMDQSAQPRTTANDGGVFAFDKLVPGRYRVFALIGEETLLERNEKFLRGKAALAESVEVTADSTTRMTLR
jgi:hypothetical protein